MEQLALTVTGMTCSGCERAVKRAVSTLDGVSSVAASHRENQVTITYDPGIVDRAAIARRIEDAGYTVGAVGSV